MLRRFSLSTLAIAVLIASASVHAFESPESFDKLRTLQSRRVDLRQQVKEFQLPNGMRWLVVRRAQAPVFSGIVMVRVGGADETLGKTGLAHMFEHMAFKGSSKLGTRDWSKEKPVLDLIEKKGAELTQLQRSNNINDKDKIETLAKELAELSAEEEKLQVRNEVWEVMLRNGAHGLNAYTSKDVTAYLASMPSNRLELWARITAEMIFDPAYREFYTERSVVAEERRTRVENSPDGALYDKLLSASFKDGPYSWSVSGAANDALGLTIADARAFHERNYVPSNMTGVIVGDVTPSQVKAVMTRVFGRYAAKEKPGEQKTSGTAASGVNEKLKFNASPAIVMAFHKPTLPDKEEYTFDVITGLLCDGRSSWLEKKLIYEEKIAKDVYCMDDFPGSRLNNLLIISVEPLKGVPLARIEKSVEKELAKLKTEPVSDEELQRVRKQATASIMYALDSNDDLAEALARFQVTFGDWRLIAGYPDEIAKVDSAEIMKVAQKYLVDGNQVTVERIKH